MAPLIPLLLMMAGSTGANYAAARHVKKERAKALAQDYVQRTKLQQDSAAKAADTANQLSSVAAKSKALAAEREAAATPIPGQPQAQGDATKTLLDVLGSTANQAIVQDAQKQGGARDAAYGGVARARMNLEDFGNLMVGANKGVMRNAQDVGHNINSAQNWERYVLPTKLAAANASGRDWNTLADALQLAASLYAPYGLAKDPATVAGELSSAGSAGSGAIAGGGGLIPSQGVGGGVLRFGRTIR